MKFEGEFDFEQANARFEEIEKEFTDKLKISTKPQQRETHDNSLSNSQSVSVQDMQDQHLIMKKALNTGSEPTEKQQQQKDLDHNRSSVEEDKQNFYDKNISFFDRISCESTVKTESKPKSWKEERKINAETFGLQQRQQIDSKPNYNRQYNGNNYRTNGNYPQQSNNGRNYPRNNNYLNNSGNQQQSNRSANTKNTTGYNTQRYNNQRVSNNTNRTGSGYNTNNNNNNYRRNEMEVNSRRFGSR